MFLFSGSYFWVIEKSTTNQLKQKETIYDVKDYYSLQYNEYKYYFKLFFDIKSLLYIQNNPKAG